jgi:hypothetical protein
MYQNSAVLTAAIIVTFADLTTRKEEIGGIAPSAGFW